MSLMLRRQIPLQVQVKQQSSSVQGRSYRNRLNEVARTGHLERTFYNI